MPEPRVYTPIYGWPMVRKASSVNEARDWFQEQVDFTNAIEATVKTIDDKLPGVYYNKTTDNATDINLEVINGAGLDTVQDWMNTVQGTGLIDGGEVTSNGDGTVDVATGRVVGKTLSPDGSPTGFYSFPATENLELLDNDINFIYVCYNGGTPVVLTDNAPKSAERDCVGIQIAYREGNDLHIASYGPDASSLLNLLSNREAEIAAGSGSPATRAFGLIAGDAGTRNVTLTAGVIYASLRRCASPAFDTSAADDFTEYYGSTGSGWVSSTQTQVNNSQYNDGTTLQTLTNNRYSTRWLYIDFNLDHLSLVIGPGDYVTQSAAIDEDTPSDLPMYLNKFGILVGQYVVQQGLDTLIVRSPFESTFSLGSVTSHTGLSNINADPANNHLSTDLVTQITTNEAQIDVLTPRFAFVGDSITFRDDSYADAFALMYPDYGVQKWASSGRKITFMYDLLFSATGLMRFKFREDFYPWIETGITASIENNSLKLLQPANPVTTYLNLDGLLEEDQELVFSGNFTSATSAVIRIDMGSTADIPITITPGDETDSYTFTAPYTVLAPAEKIKVTVEGGTTNDPIYINEFQVEMTDRSERANAGVSILAGINDVHDDDLAVDMIRAAEFLIEQIHESGNPAYLGKVFPTENSAEYTYAREQERLAYNAAADSFNCRLWDTSVISIGDQTIKPEYTSDYTHPNDLGCEILAKSFAGKILGKASLLTGNAISTWGIPFEEIAKPDTNKVYNGMTRENLLVYSEDLNQVGSGEWTSAALVTGGVSEMIATAAATTHSKTQGFDFEAIAYTLKVDITGLRTDWVRLLVSVQGKVIISFFDVNNLVIGDTQNLDGYRIRKNGDGSSTIELEFTALEGNGYFGMYIASSSSSYNTYTGNGVDPDVLATRMHLVKGGIDGTIGYVTTLDIPYQSQIIFEKSDNMQLMHADGYVLAATGSWTRIEDVDGDAMDESPQNVEAMRQAGLYKKVVGNTWGPLVAGTQFYSERGYFYELYEDTSTALTTITLAPSETPPTDNGANPLHCKGTVYTANDAIMVPSHCSSLYYAGVRNVDGDMLLDFLTGTDTNRGYRVEIEYEWRNIVAPA